MNESFFIYRQRHKQWVARIASEIKGVIFETAPFDIIDMTGRFIEVKINESKDAKHKYLVHLSADEAKFGQLMPLWVLLVIPNIEAYLIPFNKLKVAPMKEHLVGNFMQKSHLVWINKELREHYVFKININLPIKSGVSSEDSK